MPLKTIALSTLFIACCVARPAEAALVISGSTEQVVGPGATTFRVTATARDQAETVSGFMLQIMLVNGAQFTIDADNFVENSIFDFANEAEISASVFGFNAISSNSALTIGVDESVNLFELTLNLPTLPVGTTSVGNILDDASLALADASQQPIADITVVNPLTAVAVPEPGSLACLTFAGVLSFWRRQRNDKSATEG